MTKEEREERAAVETNRLKAVLAGYRLNYNRLQSQGRSVPMDLVARMRDVEAALAKWEAA